MLWLLLVAIESPLAYMLHVVQQPTTARASNDGTPPKNVMMGSHFKK